MATPPLSDGAVQARFSDVSDAVFTSSPVGEFGTCDWIGIERVVAVTLFAIVPGPIALIASMLYR